LRQEALTWNEPPPPRPNKKDVATPGVRGKPALVLPPPIRDLGTWFTFDTTKTICGPFLRTMVQNHCRSLGTRCNCTGAIPLEMASTDIMNTLGDRTTLAIVHWHPSMGWHDYRRVTIVDVPKQKVDYSYDPFNRQLIWIMLTDKRYERDHWIYGDSVIRRVHIKPRVNSFYPPDGEVPADWCSAQCMRCEDGLMFTCRRVGIAPRQGSWIGETIFARTPDLLMVALPFWTPHRLHHSDDSRHIIDKQMVRRLRQSRPDDSCIHACRIKQFVANLSNRVL